MQIFGLQSGYRQCRNILLLSCIGSVAAYAAPVSEQSFLHAIRQVESGDRYDSPRGKAGEVGAYQFRLAVWRQYTSAPFSQAQTRYADTVANRHYLWIAQTLRSAGIKPTSWRIAAAWNSGVTRVISGRIPAVSRDYATRVINLMGSDSSGARLALNTAGAVPPRDDPSLVALRN